MKICANCMAYVWCNDCEGNDDRCMLDMYTDADFHPGDNCVNRYQADNSCEFYITRDDAKVAIKEWKEKHGME